MEQALFRILYCSRNRIEQNAGETNSAIENILASARHNNSARSVTGALLYNSGFFAQVLEGPRASIEQVFEKIQRDARHGDVTVLECSNIGARDFGHWSMAHVQPTSETQATNATQALQTALGNPTTASHEVLDLLRSLVIQED